MKTDLIYKVLTYFLFLIPIFLFIYLILKEQLESYIINKENKLKLSIINKLITQALNSFMNQTFIDVEIKHNQLIDEINFYIRVVDFTNDENELNFLKDIIEKTVTPVFKTKKINIFIVKKIN